MKLFYNNKPIGGLMKRFFSLFLISFVMLPMLVNAQTYIDPNYRVLAKSFSYKLSTAPTIDADTSEWADIPWSECRYNDRDFNEDDLIDPMSSRYDYRARWKSAWVAGSNVVYFLIETFDDVIYTPDSIRQSHRDNIAIRLDPYYELEGGEPQDGDSKTSWSMRFQIDNGENTGYEGHDAAKPDYEVKSAVYLDESPIKTIMEIAFYLPENLTLDEGDQGYTMGYYPLFADNDPEDDSPASKNTVPVQWPQSYCEQAASTDNANADGRLYPDQFWRNDYYWGALEFVDLNIVNVSAGSSIQTAIDNAEEGTIIKIAGGEFSENLEISTPYIQLIGTMEDGDTTKITPAEVSSPIISISGTEDEAAGVVIKNIAFDGWRSSESGDTLGGTGIEVGSALTEVIGCYFTGLQPPIDKGASEDDEAYACVFEDNYIYECDGGFAFASPSTIVRYNTIIEGSGSYGVKAYEFPADNWYDVAFNNVINHHGECAIGYGGSGVFTIHHNFLTRSIDLWGSGDTSGDDGIENQDEGGSTDYIYNNTIVGWKSDGVQLGASNAGTSNFYLRNNLIAHCTGKDYDLRTVNSYDIDYGVSYSNDGGDSIATYAAAVSIVQDPAFTDELEDDYTIKSTSPAVDAGQTEPFGFKVMYFGEGLDIGAFETGSPVISTGIEDNDVSVEKSFVLNQNYPNPFNPTTKISFSLSNAGSVSLKVYNVLGQEVKTLLNKEMAAGSHTITFSGSDLASGIYFYTLKSGEYTATKKMMLLK